MKNRQRFVCKNHMKVQSRKIILWDIVLHTCNFRTRRVDTGKYQGWCHSGLQSKTKTQKKKKKRLSSCFGVTGDGIQVLLLAKQAFYHWSHAADILLLVFFVIFQIGSC
jgi:hypothetical protein